MKFRRKPENNIKIWDYILKEADAFKYISVTTSETDIQKSENKQCQQIKRFMQIKKTIYKSKLLR